MTRLALAVFLLVSPSLAGAADLRLSHAPALLYCMAVQLATMPDEPPPELPPELPQEQEATEEVEAAEGNGNQTAPAKAKDVAPPAAAQEQNQVPDAGKMVVDDSEQYATPQETVYRILSYAQPRPRKVVLDIGCGDGRVLIAAAKHYGSIGIGIEQDPNRVLLARRNAELAGVADRISILEGDFMQMEWPDADLVYAYLFPSDLAKIRNRLLSYPRFVTYAHKVPGLPMHHPGRQDFYYWDRNKVFAWWDGKAYTSRPNAGCNCPMCNSVVASLNEQRSHRRQPQAVQSTSQVVVYTSPNCRPCAILKQRLRAAGIPFVERSGAPGRSVPYASINGRVYTGANIYRAVGLN